jgi:excisionase family DNA binding protein
MKRWKPTKDAPTLIPIREAARLAGVSYVTIWRLVHRGEFEAVRVGDGHGPLRVDRERFLEWLHGEELR